ncbi:MAG: SDR family oxidoreductase [Deltaproteobacteria bacterium]|nr:SDR family oxidoreductase [Deltaproteobacteria bacterium]
MDKVSYGLEGKVALITGASRGIGLELARRLKAEKAQVVICARKPEGLKAAVEELGQQGVLAVPCHIAKEDDVTNLFKALMDAHGRLDILVNNVGMNLRTPGLADVDLGLWQKIVDSNLTGTFLCSRAAAGIMRGQNSGKIINVSSTAGRRAAPPMGIYGIAKAGVEMMTRVLAAELAKNNVQVNAVAPSMVKTGFSQPFWSNPEKHDLITERIPLGRLAEAGDVAGPVLFLASTAADYITGQTIVVDGGTTIV